MELWEKFDFYEHENGISERKNYTITTDAWRNVWIRQFDSEITPEKRTLIASMSLTEKEGLNLLYILQKIYLKK